MRPRGGISHRSGPGPQWRGRLLIVVSREGKVAEGFGLGFINIIKASLAKVLRAAEASEGLSHLSSGLL